MTVSDDDGGSDSDTSTVTVDNVDPTVVLTGRAAVNEGSTHTYSYTDDRSGRRHLRPRRTTAAPAR